MLRISEYVSLGHPDKIADYISQYLLDRYITHDPDTRYAVEVQIKDSHVTLGGEVASKAKFTNKQGTPESIKPVGGVRMSFAAKT
jgi:S-adenosylmethionine synthetase